MQPFTVPEFPPRRDRRGTSPHKRNTAAMQASPRCGAKTRSGAPCKAPCVAGKARCRMHGGAAGSGAPRGNRNGLKHGRYSPREAARRRRLLRDAEYSPIFAALVDALDSAPPLAVAKDALPSLYDLIAGTGADPYDAITLATGPGIGITVWQKGDGFAAACHRLGAMQERLLAREALGSWGVLMASEVPEHRVVFQKFMEKRFYALESRMREGRVRVRYTNDSSELTPVPWPSAAPRQPHAQ